MLGNFQASVEQVSRRASLHTMTSAGLVARMLLMTLVTIPQVTAEAPVPYNFDPVSQPAHSDYMRKEVRFNFLMNDDTSTSTSSILS